MPITFRPYSVFSAAGGFDEAIEAADEGGFARAREAHDDEQLALFDGKGNAGNADDVTRLLQDSIAIVTLPQESQPYRLRDISTDFGYFGLRRIRL